MLIFGKKAELHYKGRVYCRLWEHRYKLHHVRAIFKFLCGCSKELQRPKLKVTMEVDGIHSFPSKHQNELCYTVKNQNY